MKSMDELFHALLQDVYFAEKKLLVALPKLAKKSSSAELERVLKSAGLSKDVYEQVSKSLA